MNTEKKQYCKKVKIDEYGANPTILLGIIIQEKDGFLLFRTAKQDYEINKARIISITPTNEEFKGVSS